MLPSAPPRSSNPSDPSGVRRTLVLLVTGALLLRLILTLMLYDPDTIHAWGNGTVAESLVAGRGFSGAGWFVPPGPTTFVPPVYPLILAAARLAAPASPYLPILFLQSILGAATVWLAFQFFRRFASDRIALVAAALIAAHPLLVYYCGVMLPNVLATALLFAGWWALDESLKSRSSRVAVVAGFVIGVGALTEPTTLFSYPGFVLIHALRLRRAALAPLAVVALASAVTISPWVVRNAVLFHRFIPIKSNLGLNLWQGNNPHATGALYMADGRDLMDLLTRDDLDAFWSMDEIEVDAWFRRRALAFIAENPAAAAGLYLRKLAYFYHPYPPPPFRAAGPGFDMGHFPLVRHGVHFLVFVTALGGLVIACRARLPVAPLAAILLAVALIFAFFHLDNHRYRYSYEHVMLFFSAILINRLLPRPNEI